MFSKCTRIITEISKIHVTLHCVHHTANDILFACCLNPIASVSVIVRFLKAGEMGD